MAKQKQAEEALTSIPEALTQEQYISQAVSKFNPTNAAIEEYKKFMSLTINGIGDKEGLDAVHKARITVKTKRVEVGKLKDELNETAISYQKAVNAEAKRITTEFQIIEEDLQFKENKIEEEKQAIKDAEERKKQEKIQGRVLLLSSMGMVFDGANYSYGEVRMSSLFLKQCSDTEFEDFKTRLNEAKEEDRKAEEEKQRLAEEAEKERIAKEFEVEKQRLENEQKEKDLLEREQKLQKQFDELTKQRKINRIKSIMETGVDYDETTKSFHRFAFSIKKSEVEDCDDETFDRALETFKLSVSSEEKKIAEQAEVDRIAIEKQLEEKLKKEEEQRQKDAEEKERKDNLRAERKAARRPDKEKIEEFITHSIPAFINQVPILKSDEYKEIGKYIIHALNLMATTSVDLIKALEDGKE